VQAVANAEEALYQVREFNHDLAVIDLGLPGISGLELIRRLRSQDKTFPILILTARGNWQDKVEGLAAGADDYVVKPFQFEELEARLNALLRRSSGFTQSTIVAGPLLLDLNRKQASLGEDPLPLTAYEYRILEYLMRHHQQVVAKDRLMEQLYPDDDERDPNVIEVLVGRLRRKLEAPAGFKPIDTVRGLGYLFNERCQ
jgi:two-component system response regulator PhoP